MKERRLAREVAMQMLFQWEAQGVFTRHQEEKLENLSDLDIEAFLGHFLAVFYEKKQDQIDRSFAESLIRGCLSFLPTVDALIQKTSSKWKLSRMDAIDRAILRIACFELAIKKDASPKVIINEAIEIAKRYGSEQSAAFVNGILDSIRLSLEEGGNI